MKAWSLIALIAAGMLLASCGQKGNLYLPNQKKKVPATAPQPATSAPPAASPAAPGADSPH
jgi:predicted small lipoprotein YifL